VFAVASHFQSTVGIALVENFMKNFDKRSLPFGVMLCGVTLCGVTLSHALQAQEVTKENTLETIYVSDTLEQTPSESGYQAGKTRIGKTDQLPKDIPQSVTIVSNKLMQDRNADTFKEALRNVAGLTFNAGEGGRIGDNITIRGYSAVGDLYLDGMRDSAQYNRDTFNLEQIDVLRGSSSMLFGRGSTGGVINQVSKQALLTDRNIVSTTQGSNAYQRYTADINQQLGDAVALRINAMSTEADSYRDEVEQSRSGIAPTISFGIGTKNQFTLSHFHLEENNIPDMGVPYFDPDGSARSPDGHDILGNYYAKPLDVDRDTFYGMSDIDYEKNDTDITTASYTHQFDEDTEITTRLRSSDYKRDLWAVAPRLMLSHPASVTDPVTENDITGVRRGHQGRGGEEQTVDSQTDFTTHFDTGAIQHELLLGTEILREKARRWSNALPAGVVNPNADAWNPDPEPVLPDGYLYKGKSIYNYYTGESYAFYFQDVIGITDQWKILTGARWDHSKNDYDRYLDEPLTRRDIVNSWRLGLLYQPTDNSTYYVSKGSSFNPSAELYQLDDLTADLPPEKSLNTEIGAKWELLEGDLSIRTSLSRSEKTNERNTDLAVDVAVLSGARHTDAVELEIIGHVTEEWEIFTAMAYLEANIDEHSNTSVTGVVTTDEGNEPINTPHYTFNVWNTYSFGGGWRAGIGFDAIGARFANQSNAAVVPSYTRWDSMLAYEKKSYSVKLNLFNVFDQEYYESVYAGHVLPGAPRTLEMKVEYKF
jgi:catecholate siderophore receptor